MQDQGDQEPEVSPGDDPDRAEAVLRAAFAQLLHLAAQPSREAVERYRTGVRASYVAFRDALVDAHFHQDSYIFGQVAALFELSDLLRYEKVPEEAVAMLRASETRLSMLRILSREGPLRMSEMGAILDKAPQNLSTPARELAVAGLVKREEIGRTVLLSSTPLGAAVLKLLEPAAVQHLVEMQPRVGEPAREFGSGTASVPDQMRQHILSRCLTVASERQPDVQRAAAESAAVQFDREFQPDSTMFVRERLVRQLVNSADHLVRDADLPLIGDDPAMYLPGVMRQGAGGMVVDVYNLITSTKSMIAAQCMPGPTTAHLLGALGDLRAAQLGAAAAGQHRARA